MILCKNVAFLMDLMLCQAKVIIQIEGSSWDHIRRDQNKQRTST